MSKPRSLEKPLSWLLTVGGIIGVVCSFIIAYDKNQILINPKFQPGCNLNPIISCGSVMRSTQGSVFGFPNPWIGLVSFGVLTTVGLGMLAGAKYKNWFWIGLGTGCLFGMAFAYWLLFESMYRIHALCPFCLAVDVVVTTLFWYVKLYLTELGLAPIKHPKLQRLSSFIRRHHADILITWFLLVIAFILHHFWYYFGTHL